MRNRIENTQADAQKTRCRQRAWLREGPVRSTSSTYTDTRIHVHTGKVAEKEKIEQKLKVMRDDDREQRTKK
jgi:hypothetical protein